YSYLRYCVSNLNGALNISDDEIKALQTLQSGFQKWQPMD
ncbi:hypothetical protein Tco_1306308, partial [Tanacetum coccineum]